MERLAGAISSPAEREDLDLVCFAGLSSSRVGGLSLSESEVIATELVVDDTDGDLLGDLRGMFLPGPLLRCRLSSAASTIASPSILVFSMLVRRRFFAGKLAADSVKWHEGAKVTVVVVKA